MKLLIGIEIVRKALRMPCMTIAKNAGVDAAVVVSKVLDASGDVGYDALNDEYVNMIEKGIIDPTKVSLHKRCSFNYLITFIIYNLVINWCLNRLSLLVF